ncbi:hypothetical protein IL306_010280 [Fusarium sp. DS 682]|nr:hypothetical protein IL306_010280 [Fusarium sp. DS 682]
MEQLRAQEAALVAELAKVRARMYALQPHSKASLLISPKHGDEKFPYFDRRFTMERAPTQPAAFSKPFIKHLVREESMKLLALYHEDADKCPIRVQCNHWKLVKDVDFWDHKPGSVTVYADCVSHDFIKHCKVVNVFNNQEPLKERLRITSMPCRIFNDLKPDFSIFEKKGWTVVNFNVYEPDDTENGAQKMMDRYGRNFVSIYGEDWDELEEH